MIICKLKKLLVLFISFVALTCHAELSRDVKVYMAYPVSLPVCKVFFEEYDKTYNTKSQLIIKPGATGLLAMKAMQAENTFSVLCGSGIADYVINRNIYPGNDDDFNNLKISGILGTYGIVFATGNNNKYNTLPELLLQNKQISVGYHSMGIKTAASEVLKNANILWVPHKTSFDAVASLNDGSLDIYPDGTALVPLVESGKLKSLGHINTLDSTAGINLDNVYPLATKLKLVMGISISLKNNVVDINEFETRVKYIQSLNTVQDALRLSNYIPNYISSKDAEIGFKLFNAQYLKQ